MSNDRDSRLREHDRFIVQANQKLPATPTDVLLHRIGVVEPRLYDRLAEGERWVNARLDAFLTGDLDNLESVRVAWQDWIRLYRYGLRLVHNSGPKKGPHSPSATTTEVGGG